MADPESSQTEVALWLEAAVQGWRMPAGMGPKELVQEALARWLAQTPCSKEFASLHTRGQLLGIARNVRLEWWRAQLRQQRLLDHLAARPVDPAKCTVVDPELELREALLAWLCRRLPRGDAELLVAVRWDGLSWREAFAAQGECDASVMEARQRRLLRFLSAGEVQKSFMQWLVQQGLAQW